MTTAKYTSFDVLLRRAQKAREQWTAHVETRTAKLPQVGTDHRIQAENILTPEDSHIG